MKKIALIIALAIVAVSCTNSKKKELEGKWYGVSQEIPSLDSILNLQKVFLDTVGQSTTPEQEKLLYDTDNLDSLVREERAALEILSQEQGRYMKETKLEFRPDGVVVYTMSSRTDSAKWYFGEKDELIFDEMELKGAGEKTVMHVESVSANELKLRFSENDFSGTITFNKEK